MAKKKRIQKAKRGHVIRVSDYAWVELSALASDSTVISVVDDLLYEVARLRAQVRALAKAKRFYILPNIGVACESLEEARGRAILAYVKNGKKNKEEPVEAVVV